MNMKRYFSQFKKLWLVYVFNHLTSIFIYAVSVLCSFLSYGGETIFASQRYFRADVYMGDMEYSSMSESPKPSSATAGRKAYKKSLVASSTEGFVQRNHERPVLRIHGGFRSSAVGHITFFLLKGAALETVRRLSKRRFSYAWRGLQALQILCYPPFKWIQKWAPFKGLVNSMQILSRPLLVISIATAFSDQSECSEGISDSITESQDSESSSVHTKLNTSLSDTDPKILESTNWLLQLNKELENEGISLPERINEDELGRFYTASNNDFSRFVNLIKKTIHWRESYTFLSRNELEMWSNMVFWHGSDAMHRPCLIVRLGLACSTLASRDRPKFSQADHFPNRLGCLFVIRLPAVVRVIAQTFIQVFKPSTRRKLRIEGEMYQKVLSDHLPTLPSIFGGFCTCLRCSEIGTRSMLQPRATGTRRINREDDIGDNEDSLSPHPSDESDGSTNGNYDQLLRTAIISFLIISVFIAVIAGIYVPGSGHLTL